MAYQKTNPEKVNKTQRTWKTKVLPNGWTQGKTRHMWQRYSLTFERFQALVIAQDGKCAICFLAPKALVVDHDHESGVPRGLLCKLCNFALGNMRDDPARCRAAADYLEQYQAQEKRA